MAQRSAEELARLLRAGNSSYLRELLLAQGVALLLEDMARRNASPARDEELHGLRKALERARAEGRKHD